MPVLRPSSGLGCWTCRSYYAPYNLVGAATVREFYGAVTAERAVKGVLITTSDFTAQAREFAERVSVELIGLAGLQKLLVQFDVGTSPA
jgi:restriction system protein